MRATIIAWTTKPLIPILRCQVHISKEDILRRFYMLPRTSSGPSNGKTQHAMFRIGAVRLMVRSWVRGHFHVWFCIANKLVWMIISLHVTCYSCSGGYLIAIPQQDLLVVKV